MHVRRAIVLISFIAFLFSVEGFAQNANEAPSIVARGDQYYCPLSEINEAIKNVVYSGTDPEFFGEKFFSFTLGNANYRYKL